MEPFLTESELARIGRGDIKDALEWWESGGRLNEGAGGNSWSGLVQVVLAKFRAELEKTLSPDHRLLAGIVIEPGTPFDANRLFRVVLANVTEERVAEAMRLGPFWRTLDRATMSRLMRLKHFLKLAAVLQPRLSDHRDVDRVDS
ncbi:hypothetical protein FHX82_005796 [Amycolatopsis bartoniae]|uniref:Uncharacterized protein n=1 Tax=Amycolatopsis bartoniae TaxID=941986 RepID=A0A8H9MF76_9PSEU|nr:hypothetical protein [Amycolatopsis bartoniae]MBB2938718.1 hypothetical protein [Amycolatopsis bartoniae]TVT11497.1 hypothetical protein FNH07_01355 [Amycolatopsis bartoniae]GHF79661.1 hypothetical protein GCM10017566_62310 [Amycolatopsis bartoniae]